MPDSDRNSTHARPSVLTVTIEEYFYQCRNAGRDCGARAPFTSFEGLGSSAGDYSTPTSNFLKPHMQSMKQIDRSIQ